MTRLLLVGWDSADWKVMQPLMDGGQLRMVRKIVESGVMGNLATLEPILSPMLWTSIATGKRAYDHGVLGFTDVDSATGRVRPVTASARRVKAVWNILAECGFKSHVIGWFATHGERIPGGGVVSNVYVSPTAGPGQAWPPAPRGAIWPDAHAKELNELRVSPEEIDAGLVSLFVPEWEKVDQEKDRRLGHLRQHLAEALSIHAAATWTLENCEWDFVAVYYRAIDELCHHFMPLHPPKLDGVPQEQFEIYQHVVAAAYRYHDLMLARLIALAGPDTHVILVSDHGFHSDHQRPKFVPRIPAGITVWHRPYGAFAACGAQFRQDELVHGASLLDVTPTILTLFDVPVGQDMEGKVLVQAFRTMPRIETIPSWESTQAVSAVESDASAMTEQESQFLLEQFAALGYIDKPSDDPSEFAAATLRENKWTLAQSLLDGQRAKDALPLLEELCAEAPDRIDFSQTRARCEIALGLFDEAQRTIDETVRTFQNEAMSRLLRAQVAFQIGQYDSALEHLEAAREKGSQNPQFWLLLGHTLFRHRRWQDAEQAYAEVLHLREEDAMAWMGTAICRLRRGDPRGAIDAALEAVGLEFALPRAHFVLGVACMKIGQNQRAEQALKTAIRFFPKFAAAHYYLARLYRRQRRTAEADLHQTERLSILEERQRRDTIIEGLRREAAQQAVRLTGIREKALERIAANKAAAEKRKAESKAPGPVDGAETASIGPHASSSDRDTAASEPKKPVHEITIVSGLPRSGTSLLMQLLDAGGYPVLTDGVRKADDNNERGYYEWEAIRQLPKNPRIIDQAAGKAVKVISALLPALASQNRYKIIFMQRPLEEVARSQHKMRFGQEGDENELLTKVVPILRKHFEATLNFVRSSPRLELLEVDYRQLVSAPDAVIASIVAFLGPDRFPYRERMGSVVEPRLYRHRSTDEVAASVPVVCPN
jgi:predicted AlkP superfamily phosphohydrolase/phosphomutase/predicted Zn-dependent protease